MDRNEFLANIWEIFDAGDLITACSWCGRVRIKDDWVAPPAGALSTIDERLTLSHSICPTCSGAQPAPPGSEESGQANP